MAPKSAIAIVCFAACLAAVAMVHGAPAGAQITNLPGYVGPAIPFAQYSGYVNVNATAGRNLFYWFVESQNNPATDPVMLWLTGGPGCSSLFALLTEHGPFYVNPSNFSQLLPNPYSWNKVANIIYLETPSGVGFSYTTDGNYQTGDDAIAEDNLNFVLGFFQQYPEFKKNQFFVAGESYAGHYVPQLSSKVAAVAASAGINFAGFMAGNPSFEWYNDVNNYFPFMASHALTASEQFAAADKTCNGTFIAWNGKSLSPECSAAISNMSALFVDLNPYNIYALCAGKPSATGGCLTATYAANAASAAFAGMAFDGHMPVPQSQTFVPCINITAQVQYFSQAAVRQALHVAPQALVWDVCSAVVDYTQYAATVAPNYLELANKVRILVFSGDVDSCVPYLGTEANVDQLGFPVTTTWRRWFVNNQVAGYTREYAVGGSLSYATVKDAGHMVATYMPQQALAMVTRFLANEPL